MIKSCILGLETKTSPLVTLGDLAKAEPKTVIPKIILKVLFKSEVKEFPRNKSAKVWLKVKDSENNTNIVSLWAPHCYAPIEAGKLYVFRNIKVENWPPNSFPKNLGSQSNTSVKIPTDEDLKHLKSSFVNETNTIVGTVIGLNEVRNYLSCPFCHKTMRDVVTEVCSRCGENVPANLQYEDFHCELVVEPNEETDVEDEDGFIKFVAFKHSIIPILERLGVEKVNLMIEEDIVDYISLKKVKIEFTEDIQNNQVKKFLKNFSLCENED